MDLACSSLSGTIGVIREGLVMTVRLFKPVSEADPMSTTSTFYAFVTMKMMTDAFQTANPQAIAETPTWEDPTITDALYTL